MAITEVRQVFTKIRILHVWIFAFYGLLSIPAFSADSFLDPESGISEQSASAEVLDTSDATGEDMADRQLAVFPPIISRSNLPNLILAHVTGPSLVGVRIRAPPVLELL